MSGEPDPLEAEGQRLQAESDAIVRRIQRLGRPLTDDEQSQVFEQTAGLRQRIADWTARRLHEGRPEVRTAGPPIMGEGAKRGLVEARTRLRENEDFKRARSRCPAASVMAASGPGIVIRCGVEHTLLSSESDPMSVGSFCCGDHTRCPSWVAEREANWAGRRLEVA